SVIIMDLTHASRSQPAGALPGALVERPFLRRLGAFDWLFALAVAGGAGFALTRYHAFMNYYDKLVLVCAVPALVVLGWRWKPARLLAFGIAALSLLSLQIYHGDLSRADSA